MGKFIFNNIILYLFIPPTTCSHGAPNHRRAARQEQSPTIWGECGSVWGGLCYVEVRFKNIFCFDMVGVFSIFGPILPIPRFAGPLSSGIKILFFVKNMYSLVGGGLGGFGSK